MKIFYSIGVFSVCCNILYANSLPLKQGFEEELSDNWNFTTNPAVYNSGSNIWDRVSDGGEYFNPAPEGNFFWKFYYINIIPGIPDDEVCHLIFDTINLSNQLNCTLSFDYCNRGLDKADYMSYSVVFDNSNNWDNANTVILPKHDTNVSTWHTVYIPVSANAQYCRLRLSAKANYYADCGGFDNIQLKAGATAVPDISITSPLDGSFYENTTSNISLSGTATNIAGLIVWSNSLNSISGEIAATGLWSITSAALSEGNNTISVTATNQNGWIVSDEINILRGKSFSSEHLGSIAFVGFDTRGYYGNAQTDSISFVVLKALPGGTVIRFCDEEWNGIEFGTGEDDIVWSNSTATAAGSVVIIANCSTYSAISNNIGVILNGDLDLAKTADGVIAYYGDAKREPTAFLAAINTANENLNGTGLIYGETAINIASSPYSQYYSKTRSGKETWCNYLPLINASSNWEGTEGITACWGDLTAFCCKKAGSVLLVQ